MSIHSVSIYSHSWRACAYTRPMESPGQEMSVEQVASAAELNVDTVRYYQRLGLLDPPLRQGRRAIYRTNHVDRLAEIRHLADAGFTLAQIGRLAGTTDDNDGATRLDSLAAEAAIARRLTRAEVAEQAGVPEGLVALLCDNGLLEAVVVDGEQRFDQGAVSMVRAGLAVSAAGVPLDKLVSLATDHAGNVDDIVRRAISLFEEHVKDDLGDSAGGNPDDDLVEMVHVLLPAVTRLVAQHFHRTLVARALERVADGERRSLADALVAADTDHLVVTCEWR